MSKGVRILVASDAHIHDRADEVPPRLLEIIDSEKPFDIAVYAGDFTDEDVYRWFKTLGRTVYAVEGNMDYLPLPEHETFMHPIASIRFGVVHGHQVRPRGNIVQLTEIARRLGVNVLISGHTHSPLIRVFENILHLNPGSLTGAWGGGGGTGIPSMMIVVLYENGLEVRLIELRGGSISEKVHRFLYRGGTWIET
ncbi:MAG: YfcE family phosphodiesterase [Crenarchaeota archaeon]|nr:YfcE family phosphodiesterase [Thermoproteota archaeon]